MKSIPLSSIERLNLLKDHFTRQQVIDYLLIHPDFKFRVEHDNVSKNSDIVTCIPINDKILYYFIRISETECVPYNPKEPYTFKDSDGYTVFVYFKLVD